PGPRRWRQRFSPITRRAESSAKWARPRWRRRNCWRVSSAKGDEAPNPKIQIPKQLQPSGFKRSTALSEANTRWRNVIAAWDLEVLFSLGLGIWRLMSRAVFLDRDGTIIEEKEYLSDPDRIVLFPGAAQALNRLQDAGFKLLIVTNQSGIGRGYYTVEDMHRVNTRLVAELE